MPAILWIDILLRHILEFSNPIENNIVLFSFFTNFLILLLLIIIRGFLKKKYYIPTKVLVNNGNRSTAGDKKLYQQISDKTTSILNRKDKDSKKDLLKNFYWIKIFVQEKYEGYLFEKKRGTQVKKVDVFIRNKSPCNSWP